MTAHLNPIALPGLVAIFLSEGLVGAQMWSASSCRLVTGERRQIFRRSPFARQLSRRTLPKLMSIPRLARSFHLSTTKPDLLMPKRTLTEIRSLARSHTRSAINALVGVMRSKDATHAARVSAANAILDRGWGKAAQAAENGETGTFELVHRIERVIVHPEDPDSKNL